MALRLENKDGCSGRLQVFYNGTWGIVCSNSMTPHTVPLVCKQLGCGDSGILEMSSRYDKLSGIAWLDHIECGKSNSSFWQCPSAPWDPQSCDDLRDETNITCSGNYEPCGHLPGTVRHRERAWRGFFCLCQSLLLLVANRPLQLREPHLFTSNAQGRERQLQGRSQK